MTDNPSPADVADGLGAAHDALNRMKRAFDRRTGCHLTREMIDALNVSIVGQMWDEPDPRQHLKGQQDHD